MKKTYSMNDFKIVTADWIPKDQVWLAPKEEVELLNVEFKNMRGSNQYAKKVGLVKKFKKNKARS